MGHKFFWEHHVMSERIVEQPFRPDPNAVRKVTVAHGGIITVASESAVGEATIGLINVSTLKVFDKAYLLVLGHPVRVYEALRFRKLLLSKSVPETDWLRCIHFLAEQFSTSSQPNLPNTF